MLIFEFPQSIMASSQGESSTAPHQESPDGGPNSQVSLEHIRDLVGDEGTTFEELSPEAQKELKNLSKTMQKCILQSRRAENFCFEPVSLPPSRVSSATSNCDFSLTMIATGSFTCAGHSSDCQRRPSSGRATLVFFIRNGFPISS